MNADGINPPNDQSQATPKQQVVERVRAAANVLVTVRSNPSVDELASAIGLTLMLNKLGKHATAVFSGAVPSTLEFLRPEETIETNTDSLRDFIVSLDKSKADKLRYKVEENVVKIFITPYRTSITEKDLEFTQGDFNVDVVLALGVTQREELDQAITAHGRILHDATVVTITAGQHESQLGAINWQEAGASSLSEMLVSISEAFQGGIIDSQMATAFLTGIVAETERFSNPKTSPKVMTMAAQLMAAGANQQLIANELQKVAELAPDQPVDVEHAQPDAGQPENNDGALTIAHDQAPETDATVQPEQSVSENPPSEAAAPEQPVLSSSESFLPPLPTSEAGNSFEPLLPETGGDEHDAHTAVPAPSESVEPPLPPPSELPETPFMPESDTSFPVNAPMPMDPNDQIHIDEEGNMVQSQRPLQPKHNSVEPLGPEQALPADLSAILQNSSSADAASGSDAAAPPMPPFPGGMGGGNDLPLPGQDIASSTTPGSMPEQPDSLFDAPPPAAAPAEATPPPVPDATTLLEIEKTVHSPHLEMSGNPTQDPVAGVDTARNAVQDAISTAGYDANRPEPRTDLNAQPFTAPAPPAPQFDAPSMPAMNGFDPSAPPAPAEPELRSQTPGGMPLHTLGEVIPEDNNDIPPPPVPPPFNPSQ